MLPLLLLILRSSTHSPPLLDTALPPFPILTNILQVARVCCHHLDIIYLCITEIIVNAQTAIHDLAFCAALLVFLGEALNGGENALEIESSFLKDARIQDDLFMVVDDVVGVEAEAELFEEVLRVMVRGCGRGGGGDVFFARIRLMHSIYSLIFY